MSRTCHLNANRQLHAEIQRIRLLHLCLTMTRQCPWRFSLESNTTDKCGRCNSGSRIRRKSPVRGKSISHLSLTIVYTNFRISLFVKVLEESLCQTGSQQRRTSHPTLQQQGRQRAVPGTAVASLLLCL